MKRIAIFGNKSQKKNLEQLSMLFGVLRAHSNQLNVEIQQRYMSFLQRTINLEAETFETFENYEGDADMALSIGGDGTFLTTAASIGAYETPILGINSGHLGYLAAAELTDINTIIEEILNNSYTIEERTPIAVECSQQVDMARRYALNEVAILKQDTASMISVSTTLDGTPLAIYHGDGLIISTPTGSTGYNLSVGGPIIAPTAENWVISPIAPHSLNMRPLVLTDSHTLEISTQSRADTYLMSVDGKATQLPLSANLTLRKADYCVNVVIRPGYNFIDSLRAKLLWGIDSI